MTYEKVEELRSKTVKKERLSYIISAIVVVLSTSPLEIISIPTAIVISIVLIKYMPSKTKQKYIAAYNEFYVKEPLTRFFTNVIYNPQGGIDKQIIMDTGMIAAGNTYKHDNYINANYKGINFISSNATVINKEVDDINYNFNGNWMIFDFHKQFKTNIQIYENQTEAILTFQYVFPKNIYQTIKTESVQFNEKFTIQAENEHDAFYILTPSVIEKIMKLENKYNGQLLICFDNGKLHLAFNGKSLFHPKFYNQKSNPTEEINKIINDIQIITDIINELILEENIFK